jgi:hypothetical protein
MSNKLTILLALATAAVGADAPRAQTPPETPDTGPRLSLQPAPADHLNKISLSYRMGLNITVDFKKLGGFPALSNPGPDTGSTFDRTYDNGYNRVDSSGNAGGLTWNWGYEHPTSVQGAGLSLQSSSAPANAAAEDCSDDPQHGFEIAYSRELYRRGKWRAGAELAFGYTSLTAYDSRTLNTRVDRITDTFALGEVVPPLAPYHGTFEGPGPLISSSPDRVRSIIPRDSIVTGSRALEADIFMFRLGPYVEIPLSDKFSVFLNGGLALGFGDINFSYHETVTIADAGLVAPARRSAGSQTEFLIGGYAGASVSYALSREFSLFAGAIFQAAGESDTATRQVGGQPFTRKESVLNLNESIIVSIGASYSF